MGRKEQIIPTGPGDDSDPPCHTERKTLERERDSSKVTQQVVGKFSETIQPSGSEGEPESGEASQGLTQPPAL